MIVDLMDLCDAVVGRRIECLPILMKGLRFLRVPSHWIVIVEWHVRIVVPANRKLTVSGIIV